MGYSLISRDFANFYTQSQIEDLQALSRQYEYQAAERMLPQQENGEELYINQPVQVESRRRRRWQCASTLPYEWSTNLSYQSQALLLVGIGKAALLRGMVLLY